jgi:hypothetical protein
MPQLGVGIVPGGALGSQLVAVTRRAFIPSLVVQLYKANPLLSLLLKNAQRARGGVSQVTVPVQGQSFVSFAWAGYDGGFPQPVDNPAVQNAEFNLKLGVVPIPFLGMEALIQSSETVIPLLKARLADAKTVCLQSMAGALYTNNAALPLQTDSLPMAYDSGTNVANYGGINRAANTFWQSTLISAAGSVLSRTAFVKFVVQATQLAGGETPDMVVMSLSDWTTLMTDYMSLESFRTMPGTRYGADDVINAGFRGLSLADTAVFGDPFCPKGTAYLINTRYFALYLSEDAPFAFSGFHSAIPNLQIAEIGVLIIAFDVVCTKPVSGMQVTGITGGAF